MTALWHAECALRRHEATRRNEAVPLGHGRSGGHQQGDEFSPLGDLDDFPGFHLLKVTARVLAQLPYADPRHEVIVA